MSRQSSRPPSPTAALGRGKACLNCRRRKMKCDGQRPVCGQCIRTQRPDDCEYTDGQVRTRTQTLEEEISKLRTRVRELENPQQIGESVRLFDPYQRSEASRSPQGQSSTESDQYTSPSPWPASGSNVASSSTPFATIPSSRRADSRSPDSWMSPYPPELINKVLIDSLLHHASDLGFFLNIPRFRDSISSHTLDPPTLAVLNAIYVLGANISTDDTLVVEEPRLLAQALHHRTSALSSQHHPRKVLYTIQTDVLLAQYFFRNCRFFEGWCCSAAAASLVNSTGLHPTSMSTRPLIVDPGIHLPAPRDSIDEGERMSAFWTVYIMDRCWSVILGTPSLMTDTDREHGQGMSSLAAFAKAALLLKRANSLTSQWSPNFPPQEQSAFSTTFQSLSRRTENFIQSLPNPQGGGGGSANISADLILARSLAHAAIIRMHGIFAAEHAPSKGMCLASARAVFDMVRDGDMLREACANPIMPVLWVAAGQILVQAVRALRTSRTRGRTDRSESELVDVVLQSMETFEENVTCPLMRVQLARMQEAMAPFA